MKIDVNIGRTTCSGGACPWGPKRHITKLTARDELINKELQRLIKAGYAVKSGSDVELTSAGKDLYKKMTTICKKSE